MCLHIVGLQEVPVTVNWESGRRTLEIPFLFVFYLVLLNFLILHCLKLSIHSETAVPVATLCTSQRACIGLNAPNRFTEAVHHGGQSAAGPRLFPSTERCARARDVPRRQLSSERRTRHA